MKTDAETYKAVTRGHQKEAEAAAYLRDFDLRVSTLSRGFRTSIGDIAQYAHDIDLNVEGYTCQYKHCGDRLLSKIAQYYWGPYVDEKIKADRTPVDFYILDFRDVAVVVAYTPERWKVQTTGDQRDRARSKQFYVAHIHDCVPLLAWIDWVRG